MTYELDPYEQKLFDTVISLRKEVENIREAYAIINTRLREISIKTDKDSKDSLKEAIDIEELARLAVVSADIAHQAALILFNVGGIEKTGNTKKAAEVTHAAAVESTISNKLRQSGGANNLTPNKSLLIKFVALEPLYSIFFRKCGPWIVWVKRWLRHGDATAIHGCSP